MRKFTAFIFSIALLLPFFVFLRFSSSAQVSKPVDTIVVVGEMYSQITLNPVTLEVGEQSTVDILVRDSSYNPYPGRDIEIYEQNASSNLTITQPTSPSDVNGNTTGYVSSVVLGTYSVCIKDVTGGTGTPIAPCQSVTFVAIPAPVIGPEPVYTPGTSNTISWTTGGAGTYEYYVEVSTTPDFSNVVGNSGWMADTSYTATGLSDNQTYYYRVRARNSGGGVSGWSDTVSSTQDASGPNIVYTGNSPLPTGTTTTNFNPDATVTVSYTLSDNNGIGSRNFSVVLLDGTRVVVPYTATFDGTNWVATIKLGDLPKEGGINLYPAYSFYLEVSDNFGNVAGNGEGNVVVPTPTPPVEPPVKPPGGGEPPATGPSYTIPGAPVQVTPPVDPSPKWTWVPAYESDSGLLAPGYEVQWCENRNFIGCTTNTLKSDINEVVLEDTLVPGTWYVRVRVFDPSTGNYGDWSDVSSFLITKPKVEPPIVQPPTDEEKEKTWFQKLVDSVGDTVKATGENIDAFLDDNLGKLSPELRSTIAIGALAGNIVAGMNVILSIIGSIPYFLTQLSIAFLSLLGFRKKGVLSGYVYDSLTKDPIGQAIVRVFSDAKKLVWTDVTDVKGRYKTPELEDGKYYINVTARNYEYPSQVVLGGTDFPLENVYHGALFTVSNGKTPDFSIPLDSNEATRAQIAKERVLSRTKWLWKILHFVLFTVGLTFSLYALKTNPVWWNYLILFLYIPSLILLLILLMGKRDKFGIVRDDEGKVVKDITVYLSDSEFDKVVATRVTDEKGRYRFLVDPGLYTLSIASSEYVLVNSDKYQNLRVMSKASEILCPDLVIKKKE